MKDTKPSNPVFNRYMLIPVIGQAIAVWAKLNGNLDLSWWVILIPSMLMFAYFLFACGVILLWKAVFSF